MPLPTTRLAATSAKFRYGLVCTNFPIAPFIRPGYRPSIRPAALSRPRLSRRFLETVASDASPSSAHPPPASSSDSQKPSPPPPPGNQTRRPLWFRISKTLLLTLTLLTTGFTMAAAPALPVAQDLFNPPTDAETLELFTPDNDSILEIENAIFSHPLTRSLFDDPKFIATRPHLKIPEPQRAQNLTAGTLMGDDKIPVPPLQFYKKDGSEFVSIQYLGPALCGHPNIVHGGLLATLLDEGLARCCFPALPNKVGVTASLKIDYKKPCAARQVVVLRAETTKVEGRKAWVKGRLETLVDEGKGEVPEVLVEAEALFIEPRQAAGLMKMYSS